MQNTNHTTTGPTATDQSDSFTDILAQLGVPETAAEPPAQPRSASVVSTRRTVHALPRSATAAPSIDVISSEIRRLTHENTGIIASLKTKVLGDPMKRQQLSTLGSRINALNVSEEVKLALFLLGAIRLAMFEAVTNSVDAMYRHVEQYEPDSPAHEVGWKLIELNKGYLIELASEVSEVGEEHMLRAAGLSR